MKKQVLKLAFEVYDDLPSERIAAYRWLVVRALDAYSKTHLVEKDLEARIMIDRMLNDWDESPGCKDLYERRRAAWEHIASGERAEQELAKLQEEIEETC